MTGMCPQTPARGKVWKSLTWFDSEAGQEARSREVPGRHLRGAHLRGNFIHHKVEEICEVLPGTGF